MRLNYNHVVAFLDYCQKEKCLSLNTIRAYRNDLNHFFEWLRSEEHCNVCDSVSSLYLKYLNEHYSPRSVRRKMASSCAMFNYLIDAGSLNLNPFLRVNYKICMPRMLPKTICMGDLEALFSFVKWRHDSLYTRDKAIIELLIATGLRVSELVALDVSDYDSKTSTLRVFGKGSRERVIQVESNAAIYSLKHYMGICDNRLGVNCDRPLFLNRFGKRLSDRAVRDIVNKRAKEAGVQAHITPYMFRHTFATLLLEEGVDVRYIQHFLGHSSIKTTEIYTHVSVAKQREVLRLHNPRNVINGGS